MHMQAECKNLYSNGIGDKIELLARTPVTKSSPWHDIYNSKLYIVKGGFVYLDTYPECAQIISIAWG